MRLKPRFILPLMILMLVISYQNFSSVDPEDWDTKNTLKVMNEMNNFEKNNPNKPVLATPQGGSDLKSVSDDWMQRQGTIILNGYDKKLEYAMNEKLNSWVHEITRKDPADEALTSSSENQPGAAAAATTSETSEEAHQRMKQNLRFARVNSLKYELGENSCLNLTADPGNTHFDYSQIISSNTKMGLEHRTSDNKTQMFFKYEW